METLYIKTSGFVNTQYNIHILDCRAGCTLAQIIESGDENDALVVAVNADGHIVTAGECGGGKHAVGVSFLRKLHQTAGVVLLVQVLDVLDAALEVDGEDRHGDFHAAIKIAHHRTEDRCVVQAAELDHLWQVLWLLTSKVSRLTLI